MTEKNDEARQRFTLTHELRHLILDSADSNRDIEKICNKFAFDTKYSFHK